MLTLLLWCFLGTIVGFVTALIPGIHVNVLALFIAGIAVSKQFTVLPSAVFLVSGAVAHLIAETIPSVFLKSADSSTALMIHPSQRMMMRGRGYEAVLLATAGGLGGYLAVLLFLPVFFLSIPTLYSLLRPRLGLLLLVTLGLMILTEKRKLSALLVITLSGIFGLIVLKNMTINVNYLLFPVLTGLFGISGLWELIQTRSEIPVQRKKGRVKLGELMRGSSIGLLGGILAGFLPGIGSSQSLLFAQNILRMKKRRTFLVALGAINVVDVVLSLLALIVIGNPRSGVAVTLQTLLPGLTTEMFLVLAIFGVIAALITSWTTLKMTQQIIRVLPRVKFRTLSFTVLVFLGSMIVILTGPVGLLYAALGALLGRLPGQCDVKKSLLMGTLFVPTMLFFLGVLPEVTRILGL